jgi:integrase
VRVWRWADITLRGGTHFYSWENKGKSGTDEIPSDAWAAVEDYLRLTGRLNAMRPEDYIFRPTSDSPTRLKRPDGSPVIDPGDWTRNRPISAQQANADLRSYARRAGLEADQLHIHSLRHSASMLYRASGMDIEERSRMLHHSNIATTQIYDHQLAGQRNTGWAKAAGLLGL